MYSIHILEMIGVHIPLVVGMFITQRLLKIPDLSVETAYMMGGMSSCFLVPYLNNAPSIIAIPSLLITGLFAGGLVGLSSSLFTTRLHIHHLFSAIITSGLWNGIIFFCMNPYQGLSGYTNHLALIKAYGILPVVTGINIILGFMCIKIMRSQGGYLAIAVGSNKQFFNTFGLPLNIIFCSGVIIANSLAGLSGYLVSQTIFFADVHMGLGKVLFALVALMIGRLCIPSVQALFSASCIGVTIQIIVQQLLLKVGFNLNYFSLIHGIILLGIIAASQYTGRKSLIETGF